MDNRFTMQDIAESLVASTGKTTESIEKFLSEFVSVVKDQTFADRLVQIKSIGAFKIIQVEKRESVDVNTKERIVIPEHYKLSFTPDKDMREIVNKPFAFFESVEIADDADVFMENMADEKEKDDDTEEELLPPPPPVHTLEAPEEIEEPEEAEEIEEEIPQPQEPQLQLLPEPEPQPEPEPEPQPEPEPEPEQIPPPPVALSGAKETKNIATPAAETVYKTFDNVITEEKEIIKLRNKEMADFSENKVNRPSKEKDGSNNNALVILLLTVVAILIISLVSVLFFNKEVLFPDSQTADNTEVDNQETQFSLPSEHSEASIDEEWGLGYEDEQLPVDESVVATPPASTRKTVAQTIRIERGDRLNLLALKYYGNKVFWVYIYQHNQSKLGDPDNIQVGVELVIPAASDYQIDANDPVSVKKASALQSRILSEHSGAYGSSFFDTPRQRPDPFGF